MNNKTILLTGGGTAGHVTPNLALLPKLKAEGFNVEYIGSKKGIERELIEHENIKYHTISVGKLRRYFSWENFLDLFRVIGGCVESAVIIGKVKPSIIFSKGGFVAVPVVIAAKIHKIPVVCHESDITPGLATKISARFAKKVACTFPECVKLIGPQAVRTGTPLRAELFQGKREKGLTAFGFNGKKPVLLVTGGSQGAQAINDCIRKILPQITKKYDVIHLCGKGKLDNSLREMDNYKQIEYINEGLNDAFAAADIIVSRAGSNAINELRALYKPMLLIPYPMGASRGDQILNASSYEKRGFSMVLEQNNLNEKTLINSINDLYNNRMKLIAKMKSDPVKDGCENVLKLIRKYMK